MSQELPSTPSSPIPEQVGPYRIVRRLGKGGMGEVFLAQDPQIPRLIALKRIRPALANRMPNQRRFLREAEVTGQLTHPAIIPILSLSQTPPDLYFTMPYIEGKSLRQLLLETPSPSIASLLQIFVRILEAIAYAHAKGFLHRDIKPENIMVGTFGEVILLDWGIAERISESVQAKTEQTPRPEKVAGTLAYMPPERLQGGKANVQSDLYALGVILYQILTLQLPFHRKTLAQYRKTADVEQLIDPQEMAPQRDIPPALADIAKRALQKDPHLRYASVASLLEEIHQYLEGRPEWHLALTLKSEEDWQPSEHLFLPKHLAISSELDSSEWALLQLSKASFTGPLKIEATLKLAPESSGVGLLLGSLSGHTLEESTCLLLGPTLRLFRNYIPIYSQAAPSFDLPIRVRIEKSDDKLAYFLNDTPLFTLSTHVPLPHLHIGLLAKDSHFKLEKIDVFDASREATVNCLAVPNALFSHKLYDLALEEYRRIGRSFPGRAEGREALFRAGLVLLQMAKVAPQPSETYHLALKEFEQLYRTSGAPLEYLGKSLVYKALNEPLEEAKCLEYALRRYAKHPLSTTLREHLTYRLFESSIENRESAYRMLLLAYRYAPHLFDQPDPKALVESLQKSWEPLPFLTTPASVKVSLAVWLGLKHVLVDLTHSNDAENALFCLYLLGGDVLPHLERFPSYTRKTYERLLAGKFPLDPLPSSLTRAETRFLFAYFDKDPRVLLKWTATLSRLSWPQEDRERFDARIAWQHLKAKKTQLAGPLFKRHATRIHDETSPLFLAYGCFLYLTRGPKSAKEHLSTVAESPHPPLSALPSLFLLGKLDETTIEHLLFWEKHELHRQVELFYSCVGKKS